MIVEFSLEILDRLEKNNLIKYSLEKIFSWKGDNFL
jgi:hypothetical protein